MRDAVDAGGAKDEGAACGRQNRVVLTPRRRRQVSRRQLRWMTVTNKPDRRGERDISVNTIARGMSGDSGVTVVTMLVCFVFCCTRGCGRI